MNVLEWQLDIYRRLKEGLPNTIVHLEGVPESTPHPKGPTGLIKPFLIIWFGQLTDVTSFNTTVSDLCGNENGEGGMVKTGNFLIQTVAPTGLALIQLENVVRGLLTGYRPAGEGELFEGGYTTIRDPAPTGIGDTLRFYKPLYFHGTVTVRPVQVPVLAAASSVSVPVASTSTVLTVRTHCEAGHELSGANLIEEKRGQGRVVRRCRTCVNAKARDNYARRKQT